LIIKVVCCAVAKNIFVALHAKENIFLPGPLWLPAYLPPVF